MHVDRRKEEEEEEEEEEERTDFGLIRTETEKGKGEGKDRETGCNAESGWLVRAAWTWTHFFSFPRGGILAIPTTVLCTPYCTKAGQEPTQPDSEVRFFRSFSKDKCKQAKSRHEVRF